MTVMVAHVHKPCVVRQEIKAGSDFDGLAPADGVTALDATFDLDCFYYAAGTHGGLVDPTSSQYSFYPRDALNLLGMEFKGGGQSAWKLELIDRFGTAFTIWSGTNEASVVKGPEPEHVLIWGSKLKFTTTGAATAMVLNIKLGPQELCIEDQDRAV